MSVIAEDGSDEARRFPNFEITEGSLANFRTLEIAFSGEDALFWCPSHLPAQRGKMNAANKGIGFEVAQQLAEGGAFI